MAKLTKTQITNGIAEGASISKAQAKDVLETLASMVHANARDGFTIPGIGKVSVRQTAPREMVMRFGPREGETIQVPAKTKLKFTFLKVAKEAILG
jgi:DNA-binding protein HU-beta